MLRILICGDRNWTDYFAIRNLLKTHMESTQSFHVECVIEGEASGADTFARIAATELGIKVLSFPANWKEHGKSAGPIRNTQMLVEGKPNLVWAFHDHITDSKGTSNMVVQSKKAGIRTVLFYHQLHSKDL